MNYPGNFQPKSEITSPQALEAVLAFLGEIGKKAVVVRDSPGFFMTRFMRSRISWW